MKRIKSRVAIPRFRALLTDSLQVKSAKELPLNAFLCFLSSPVFQKKATRRLGNRLPKLMMCLEPITN